MNEQLNVCFSDPVLKVGYVQSNNKLASFNAMCYKLKISKTSNG